MVAAVGDRAVAGPNLEARRARSMRKQVIRFLGPARVSSSPVATKVMTKSARSAWLMKCLVPVIT